MEIVNFLRDYWQYISAAILIVLNLLLFIFRRKPKTWNEFIEVLSHVLYYLPQFIQDAESLKFDKLTYPELENALAADIDPDDRKGYVLSWCLEIIESRLKRDLSEKEFKCFYDLYSKQIEEILTCPTKKGGIGREEDE